MAIELKMNNVSNGNVHEFVNTRDTVHQDINNNGVFLCGNRMDNDNAFERSNSSQSNESQDPCRDDALTAFIYRYKFTQNFMEELYKFSKVHQYDDRKSFKEAWEIWIKKEDDIIKDEITRLDKLGYDGDVLDKMFKSARYYFRKKSTSKPDPNERRKYVGVHKDLLDAMDLQILAGRNIPEFKPSDGFVDFCKSNTEKLKNEIGRLLENQMESDEILNKIKKTYKNRYFMAITK